MGGFGWIGEKEAVGMSYCDVGRWVGGRERAYRQLVARAPGGGPVRLVLEVCVWGGEDGGWLVWVNGPMNEWEKTRTYR